MYVEELAERQADGRPWFSKVDGGQVELHNIPAIAELAKPIFEKEYE
jgi:hypothetical protein